MCDSSMIMMQSGSRPCSPSRHSVRLASSLCLASICKTFNDNAASAVPRPPWCLSALEICLSEIVRLKARRNINSASSKYRSGSCLNSAFSHSRCAREGTLLLRRRRSPRWLGSPYLRKRFMESLT